MSYDSLWLGVVASSPCLGAGLLAGLLAGSELWDVARTLSQTGPGAFVANGIGDMVAYAMWRV